MLTHEPKSNSHKQKVHIMNKAMKLFMTKGYDGTSINDVCVAAKLTKPTLYYYFHSKKNLLFSVHMRAIEEILHPYMKEIAMIRDPVTRLETMIRDYGRLMCSHAELRFFVHDTLLIKDRGFDEITNQKKALYVLFRDTIAELQSASRINKDLRPSWTALQVLDMITGVAFWLGHKKKDQIAKLTDSMVEMVLHGIDFKNI